MRQNVTNFDVGNGERGRNFSKSVSMTLRLLERWEYQYYDFICSFFQYLVICCSEWKMWGCLKKGVITSSFQDLQYFWTTFYKLFEHFCLIWVMCHGLAPCFSSQIVSRAESVDLYSVAYYKHLYILQA